MLRRLCLPAALVVIVVSGLAHGLAVDRWGASADRRLAVARLSAIPSVIGDWAGESLSLPERQVAVSGIDGYVLRRYVNQHSGERVTVLIVCGKPGPVALHTPDVCFEAQGYAQAGAAGVHALPAAGDELPHEMKVGKFARAGPALADDLRIAWSWTADGRWQVPESPRVAFRNQGALYKLYVMRSAPRVEGPFEKDPATAFIKLLLPELRSSLFPS
jgi:hypothetical protein